MSRGYWWEPFLGLRGCSFFSFPQNDPDKEYNMPKDGTVHELTSNVGPVRHCRSGAKGTRARLGVPHWEPSLPRAPGLREQALVVEG